MIPLALVTGFLGSGKTTLLKQLAHRYRGRKIVYLVNEFSARDVDAAVLGHETENVVSIAGGSIFCRCLVTEFLDQLRNLPSRFGSSAAPVEGVVVAASGIANPASAAGMLREARLESVYRLSEVLAVADPGSFFKLLHTLPNIRAQIEAASRVLLNKTDLHPAALIEQTEASIREINPRAQITRTVRCAADIDVFKHASCPTSSDQPSTCGSSAPSFVTFHTRLDHELDLDRFQNAVSALDNSLCRVKGFATRNGTLWHLDYSPSGWVIEKATTGEQPGLVFIVQAPCQDATRQLAHDVRSGRFDLSNP